MLLHASCVAFEKRAVLIKGGSGSGKSSLALELMAYGGQLVSDDQTQLHLINQQVIASAPARLSGLIEARGIGILHADPLQEAQVVLVALLDQVSQERVPPPQTIQILGADVPMLHKSESTHFAAALRQYVLHGRAQL